MRILITGIGGFVRRNLKEYLSAHKKGGKMKKYLLILSFGIEGRL